MFYIFVLMQIQSPCAENYNRMTPVKNGRFCNSCQTAVVDFTKMSDEEIKNFLIKHQSDSLCIRAKSYQLDSRSYFEKTLLKLRDFASLKIRVTPLKIAVLAGVSALLSLSSCFMGKRCPTDLSAYEAKPKKDTSQVQTPQKK